MTKKISLLQLNSWTTSTHTNRPYQTIDQALNVNAHLLINYCSGITGTLSALELLLRSFVHNSLERHVG